MPQGFATGSKRRASSCLHLPCNRRIRPERAAPADVKPLDGFGDEIEMLASMQRHGHARCSRQIARPHPAQLITTSVSIVPCSSPCAQVTPGHPAILLENFGDLDVLDDLRAALARTLGKSHGDIGRIALAV